ncbi:glycosyltransferase [Natrinema caseinilyticum]|uniref:glycosyltransferase n=1 Tax=Natrinema caseinilyticum TaxID=2961570 RepID=UPI0020C44D62|nr:glycosyltransferase [Natrinema caseinilyticum]
MTVHVTAFTDTYLPTVNGVTYTIDLWQSRWNDRYGRMDVVYPRSPDRDARGREYPVPSVPVPTYRGHRLGFPVSPSTLPHPDVVHVHSPFTLGLAGLRFATRSAVPVVASYHTVLIDRIEQRFSHPRVVSQFKDVCRKYEQRFYDAVDLVVTPTVAARRYVRDEIDPDTQIEVVSNGIDTATFRPVDSDEFIAKYDIDDQGPLIGYTGRHGPEKFLSELIEAAADLDVTVLLAGDGPCRPQLIERAQDLGCNTLFLGFLSREELPAFYSALDVFVFPGRIETQGLVALEATACGTPVVAAEAGALPITVLDGETGYHYPPGNIRALRKAIRRVLANQERLREFCLRRRETLSVEHSLDRVESLYDNVTAGR